MSLVTFIIPTKGRPTLKRTLKSLLNQTCPDWEAIVVADCVPDFLLPLRDPRVLSFNLPEKMGRGLHLAAEVRNFALDVAHSEWIGFVDDDDTLDSHYVQWLQEEGAGFDVVIFRMRYRVPRTEDGAIVIPRGRMLQDAEVGISFAVREDFRRKHDLRFPAEECEDCRFLQRAQEKLARIKYSNYTAYYVRP